MLNTMNLTTLRLFQLGLLVTSSRLLLSKDDLDPAGDGGGRLLLVTTTAWTPSASSSALLFISSSLFSVSIVEGSKYSFYSTKWYIWNYNEW